MFAAPDAGPLATEAAGAAEHATPLTAARGAYSSACAAVAALADGNLTELRVMPDAGTIAWAVIRSLAQLMSGALTPRLAQGGV